MTAEFHQALAANSEEPDLRPEPFTELYQHSLYQSLRASVRQRLAQLRRLFDRVPEDLQSDFRALIDGEQSMLAGLEYIRRNQISGQRTRVHGSYRLDELRLIEGDFYVLDLSGDHTRPMSERRLQPPPLRGVAALLPPVAVGQPTTRTGRPRSAAVARPLEEATALPGACARLAAMPLR